MYSEVRGVVMNYCKTRQLVKKPFYQPSSDDMDIGALWKNLMKGKGKGKDKGKGKGKDQGKHGNKGKGKPDKGKGKGKKGNG